MARRREAEAPTAEIDLDVDADPVSVARTICLRLLTVRARTRAELAKALASRGVPEDAAEEVLGRFGDVGLIDDAVFAQSWVTSRHLGRGLARRALAWELRQRGVGDDDVRTALEGVSDEDELAAARDLARRRLYSLASQPVEVQRRRVIGLLARKGYGGAVAYRVVRELLDAAPDEDVSAVD